MSERVLDRVIELADQFKEQAVEAEKIGKLPDATVKSMKAIGSIRLLQPASHSGLEVHPREFAETVMATAALDPAAGWINGVVGVHPYQLAYADPRVADEIWADDVDTWVASPYAPQGVAKPVDGGYIFNGRWQFSSGTDACDWIILGAMLGDADGKPLMPPQMLHMILPRQDYEIVPDSWDVVGLRGTGSKDVIVKDAFVPEYRTMDAMKVMDGTAQIEAGMSKTLYKMPWSTMFPLGISSATIGICEGALAAHLDYQRERVGANGTAIKDDPYVMYAVAEAAADINAARQEILANVDRIYDIVDAGREVSFERPRRRPPDPGACGVARRLGRRPDLLPLGRQRASDGQAPTALLARRPRRCRPCHPRTWNRLPRIGAELPRCRSAGSAAGDDLRRPL